MAGTRRTEEYWGRTIEIATDQQPNGQWHAVATVHAPGSRVQGTAPLEVSGQPTEQAAVVAARSLAAGAIDGQRVAQGKP